MRHRDGQGGLEKAMQTAGLQSLADLAKRMLELTARAQRNVSVRALERQLSRVGKDANVFAKSESRRRAFARALRLSERQAEVLLRSAPRSLAPSPGTSDDAPLSLDGLVAQTRYVGPTRQYGGRETYRSTVSKNVDVGLSGEWIVPSPNLLLGYTDLASWVVAPSGTGKTLGVRTRQELDESEPRKGAAYSVRQLTDLPELPDLPLYIDVQEPSPLDLEIGETLRRRARVIVAAPFRRPTRADDGSIGTLLDGNEQARWLDWHWSPISGWRERLLKSFLSEMGEGRSIDAGAAFRWLENLDPGERLVRTPGDVAGLVRLLVDTPALLDASSRQGALERLVASWQADDKTRRRVRHLACRALDSLERPWPPSASADAWQASVGASPLQDVRQQEVFEALDQLENAPKKAQSDHLRRLRRLVGPTPQDVIELLRSERLLRVGADGDLEIHPRWAAEAYAVAEVKALLSRTGNALQWGRLAVSSERRHLVLAAVQELETEPFTALLRDVLATFDPDEVGAVAAMELLLDECGRRILDSDWALSGGDRETLADLVRLQFRTLRRRADQTLLSPTTSGGLWLSDPAARSWVQRCWAISFTIDPPGTVPPGAEWLFPGWCRIDPAAPEVYALRAFTIADLCHPRFDFGTLLLDRLGTGTKPPSFLVPHAFVRAAERNESFAGLGPLELSTPAEIIALAQGQKQVAVTVATELFLRLVPTYGALLQQSAALGPESKRWVLDHVDLQVFRKALGEMPKGNAPSLMRAYCAVPRRLWSAITDELASTADFKEDHLWSLADVLGREQLQVLEDLRERLLAEGRQTWWVVRRIAQLAPHRAVRLVGETLRTAPDAPSTRDLVWETGEHVHAVVIAALEELSTLPSWTESWLVARVQSGDRYAERAFCLLRKVQASP